MQPVLDLKLIDATTLPKGVRGEMAVQTAIQSAFDNPDLDYTLITLNEYQMLYVGL